MNTKQVTLGIDIGGTNAAFGFLDEKGHCYASGSMPTSQERTPEAFVKAMSLSIRNEFEKLPEEIKLVGIGIGAPNGNYFTSTIDFAPNLSWKGIVPLGELFEKEFNLRTFITNDANAAALGEMVYGAAKELKDFVVITIGTGLGSGIVVNGEMVHGATGFAGELGHFVLDKKGRQCSCGRKGCVETYISARGVRWTLEEVLKSGKYKTDLLLDDLEEITTKIIHEAASKGDEAAIETFRRTGEILGEFLANVVVFTSPASIILFGGIVNAGEILMNPTREHFEKNLLDIFKGRVKLEIAKLNQENAAIYGAAGLAWNELNKIKA